MSEVLQIVTNERAPFFRQQVRGLERLGHSCTILGVPSRGEGRRSPVEYARFYGELLTRVADDVDVVHANYGLTAPAALAQPHRPIVLSLWGSDLLGEFGELSTWCANRCSEVIVMTHEMADTLDCDSYVIPHGIEVDLFEPIGQTAARSAVGWPDGRPVVLFPYDPDREVKNYDLAATVTDAAADRLGVPVSLEVVTGVPHDEVPLYLNAADVLLLTSHREGSPNAVKEALACDVPVVATDVGDVKERLAGLEYSTVGQSTPELVDAVVAILEARPVTEGRSNVEHLSLESTSRRINEVYRAALAPEGVNHAGV